MIGGRNIVANYLCLKKNIFGRYKMTISMQALQEAADYIMQQTPLRPRIAFTLGSGMGPLADELQNATTIPYADIPHFARSTVQGHAGQLVIGELQGHTVLAMQGRYHFYEGHDMQAITLPVRVMKLLGVEIFIVTNAAGGLNQTFSVGDLMLITDHINFTGMAGHHPLIGANLDAFGPRFPDMSTPYDLELQAMARRAAQQAGFTLQEGVYVSLSGPSFETPAEIRFLQIVGGDAVGMSTAPEVVVARHSGIRVLGISGISNVAITDTTSDRETTHEEVLEASHIMASKLVQLVKGVLAELANPAE